LVEISAQAKGKEKGEEAPSKRKTDKK